MGTKIVFAILTIFLCLDYAQAREWYEGGTLHSATVEEFCNASPQNRLATAGDWIAGTTDKTLLHENTSEQIRTVADELQECVLKGGESAESIKTQQAMTVAVFCMGMMRDKYPWLLTRK